MGINNFCTYVEKALRWPVSLYDKDDAFCPKTEPMETCDSQTETAYFDEVFRLFHRRLGITTGDDAHDEYDVPRSPVAVGHQRTVQGICVDLSSFCYGIILDEVRSNHDRLRFRRSPSPVPQDVLDKSESATAENGEVEKKANGENGKKIKLDAFEESETYACSSGEQLNRNDHRSLKTTIVDTVLDDHLIEQCAQRCYEKLFNVIGQDRIVDAHYFSLHYDENTTTCKWFAQYKRRCGHDIIVSKESRSRIFVETIRLVQTRLVFETKRRLTDAVSSPTLFLGSAGHRESALKFLANDEFVNDVVLEKMLLTGCGPGSDIRRQRYVSGEGEWKCFYTMLDVERNVARAQRNTRCVWLVFGNDSDIGVGVLLHASCDLDVRYVGCSKRQLAFAEKHLHQHSDAYRALHFFSLSLLGNDYVPRLVNESTKNITALGDEVDRMIYSPDVSCQRYVQLLSKLFSHKSGGGSQEGDNNDEDDDEENASSVEDRCIGKMMRFSKAIAYVFTRLLVSVYGGHRTADTRPVEEYFERSCGSDAVVEEEEYDCRLGDELSIRCKDDKNRSFREYFAAFAACTLWYTAYCTFYRHVDAQDRQCFQTKCLGRGNDTNQRMHLPALPVATSFQYNDQRLHELVRFEPVTVVDLRRAIGKLTRPVLSRIIEQEIMKILQK